MRHDPLLSPSGGHDRVHTRKSDIDSVEVVIADNLKENTMEYLRSSNEPITTKEFTSRDIRIPTLPDG